MVGYDGSRVFGDGLLEEALREEMLRPLYGDELERAKLESAEIMGSAIERLREAYRKTFRNPPSPVSSRPGLRYTG